MTASSTVGRESHYHTAISAWPVRERPREKLLDLGSGALSDAELLAILLRTGSGSRAQRITAMDLAKALLLEFGSLRALASRQVLEYTSLVGMGEAKAIALAAAFEIGRRMAAERREAKITIHGPEDVVSRFGPHLRDLKFEIFSALLLDSANHLMRDVEVSRGILNSSLAHPREVFCRAITERAAAVILLHNHPSGHPEPSVEDIHITKQITEAGRIIGIPVHDHIIIAGESYTSFVERGLM